MDSWSYLSKEKRFPSNEPVAFRNPNWDLKSPSSCEKSVLVSKQQPTDGRKFMVLNFPEMMSTQLTQQSPNPDAFSGEEESKLSSSVVESNGLDSCIVLKLGNSADNPKPSTVGTTSSSSESCMPSAKRMRAMGVNSQTPCCMVYGCNKDLSSSKDYHKKHKVCELHSKSPKVIVNGLEQRFCQQCSRFQLLGEFDDGKRSCRKQLAEHNERRRKSRMSILSDGISAGRLLHSCNGQTFKDTSLKTSFTFQNILPSTLLHQENYNLENFSRLMKLEEHLITYKTNGNYHLKFYNPEQYSPLHGNVFNIENFICSSSLSCSSVFANLAAASTSQDLSRISDSGSALSLLSSQSHNDSNILDIIPQATTNGISNNFSSTGLNFHGESDVGPFLTSEYGRIFQEPDTINIGDANGTTIDLLQLSSQLNRVEHQRQSMQVKQEDDAFGWPQIP